MQIFAAQILTKEQTMLAIVYTVDIELPGIVMSEIGFLLLRLWNKNSSAPHSAGFFR